MTRSRKKNPVHGITTARTEKGYKVAIHRAARRIVRQILGITGDGDDVRITDAPRYSTWDAPKDGKRWAPDWFKVWRK